MSEANPFFYIGVIQSQSCFYRAVLWFVISDNGNVA